MTLKRCPKCDKINTTKTATFVGRQELGFKMLLFNCACGGTFAIMNRTDVIQIWGESQASAMYDTKQRRSA